MSASAGISPILIIDDDSDAHFLLGRALVRGESTTNWIRRMMEMLASFIFKDASVVNSLGPPLSFSISKCRGVVDSEC